MTAPDRLLKWFDDGTLIRPAADEANFVDLLGALHRRMGIDEAGRTGEADRLGELIGPAEHYLLVLVDGMGSDLVDALPAGGFMRTHVAEHLRPVFPSTTATAITTLHTGLWPAAHGACGWWMYLPDRGLSVVTLPFWQRHTRRPLEKLGVSAADVFEAPSVWPRLTHRPAMIVPDGIVDSTYSRYASGGRRRVGYADLDAAFAAAADVIERADAPSFTYLYLPQADGASHRLGPGHDEVAEILRRIDAGLGQLADQLAGRARIVVTADHGHAFCAPERRNVLPADDPLASRLLCQPVGEPTVPIFHVRPGEAGAFAAEFNDRFGEQFALLTVDEVEALRLFGPGELSATMRRRLGDFVGIAPEPTKFYIKPVDDNVAHLGVHGGLSPIEMTVPLIVEGWRGRVMRFLRCDRRNIPHGGTSRIGAPPGSGLRALRAQRQVRWKRKRNGSSDFGRGLKIGGVPRQFSTKNFIAYSGVRSWPLSGTRAVASLKPFRLKYSTAFWLWPLIAPGSCSL